MRCCELLNDSHILVALLLLTTSKMALAEATLRLESEYDADADVLYVLWGETPTTHGIEIRPGVVLRLTDDDEALGATFYDVTRYFPFNPTEDLIRQSAALLARVLAERAR